LLPLADAALRSGERKVGMWIFRAIAELLPEDAARLANLALAHRHVGQVAEARRVYERALQLAPNDSWTWNDYGLLLRAAGDPAAARAAFERSIACDAKFGEGPGITNLVVEAAQGRVDASARAQVLADASRALLVRPDAALLRRAAIDLVLRDAGVARPQQHPDKGAAVR
jgi:Tfp pilus assembly protein PilF